MAKTYSPHLEVATELQHAYDFFNNELFEGVLPGCMITLQREKTSVGYFSSERFGNKDGHFTDEIAMNPSYFAIYPILETLQTLVHEMAHLWQAHFGKPGRGRYHNEEWAQRMEAIGLMPSHDGRPGGKRTGDHMRDYVIEGGRFIEAAKKLITAEFEISWHDRFPPAEATLNASQLPSHQLSSEMGLPAPTASTAPAVQADLMVRANQAIAQHTSASTNKSNRVKYSCACSPTLNFWGKAGIMALCQACNTLFKQPNSNGDQSLCFGC